MKRTTKRRLGLAGLVVAVMMLLVFFASSMFEIGLEYFQNSRNVELVCVEILRGMLYVHIEDGGRSGDWAFHVLGTHSPQGLFWWPKYEQRIHTHQLFVPLWIPTLLIAIPSFLLWRRNRKLPEGHCNCGYNLTGNMSGVCPECGRKLQEEGDNVTASSEDSAK